MSEGPNEELNEEPTEEPNEEPNESADDAAQETTGDAKTRGPKFFVPEVIQTSAMDCGPASLKAALGGFGIHVNYDRLRERCQTDVDGTSVAALETLGQQLGLNAETILVQLDTLLMKDAKSLPAIVVTNTAGGYHFVVVWSVHGNYLQIMDPGSGRTFVRKDRFLERVASVSLPFQVAQWRDWAETGSDSIVPLRAKMMSIGATQADCDALITSATQDAGWHTFAALDAAVRMVRALVDSGAIPSGRGAVKLVGDLVGESVAALHAGSPAPIPQNFWTVQAAKDEDGESRLHVTGAVLLYVESALENPAESLASAGASAERAQAGVSGGRLSIMAPAPIPGRRTAFGQSMTMQLGEGRPSRMSMWSGHVMPKTLVQELAAADVRPHKLFWDMARLDAKSGVFVMLALAAFAVLVGTIDVLVMRGLSDVLGRLALPSQRVSMIVAIVGFLLVALLIESVRSLLEQRIGRGLETRLRVTFLEKLPKLEDRYLKTRPISDMASRAHLLQTLREVPTFAVQLVNTVLNLFVTGGLLIWLFPEGWWLVLTTLAISMTIPLVAFRGVDDQFGKIATHGGALFRFYLDALLGVVPVRVHGAERVIRREHEGLLTEWARSSRDLQRAMFAIHLVDGIIGGAITVGLVYAFIAGGGAVQKMLILVYFAQRVPSIGSSLINVFSAYPPLKHNALRLFEPLGAAETNVTTPPQKPKRGPVKGVALSFKDVEVVASGRALLSGLNLDIPAGSHIGIVGASGAGKSSLLSVLLGWLQATSGRVTVDGRPLDAPRLARLREDTAWVDPGIHLWNASILDNLLYGSGEEAIHHMQDALERSDVLDVLERLPEGLLTNLGEGGARVSGGQGQRIRFARALMKKDARLVLLDEPFRGLERDRRQTMLARAREYWKTSTLVLVSHDVSDTLGLDRVLVVDDGRVIEDASPADLMADPNSRYRTLVEADREVRVKLWEETAWRRVRIERGNLIETKPTHVEAAE